jgi:hypothetical protein
MPVSKRGATAPVPLSPVESSRWRARAPCLFFSRLPDVVPMRESLQEDD